MSNENKILNYFFDRRNRKISWQTTDFIYIDNHFGIETVVKIVPNVLYPRTYQFVFYSQKNIDYIIYERYKVSYQNNKLEMINTLNNKKIYSLKPILHKLNILPMQFYGFMINIGSKFECYNEQIQTFNETSESLPPTLSYRNEGDVIVPLVSDSRILRLSPPTIEYRIIYD